MKLYSANYSTQKPPGEDVVALCLYLSGYNPVFFLLESIYRRGARRWRKLYCANGHTFQAKRFNRVRLLLGMIQGCLVFITKLPGSFSLIFVVCLCICGNPVSSGNLSNIKSSGT